MRIMNRCIKYSILINYLVIYFQFEKNNAYVYIRNSTINIYYLTFIFIKYVYTFLINYNIINLFYIKTIIRNKKINVK